MIQSKYYDALRNFFNAMATADAAAARAQSSADRRAACSDSRCLGVVGARRQRSRRRLRRTRA